MFSIFSFHFPKFVLHLYISVWVKLAENWGIHSKETLVIPLAVLNPNITQQQWQYYLCSFNICFTTKGDTAFSSLVHHTISQVTSQPLNKRRKELIWSRQNGKFWWWTFSRPVWKYLPCHNVFTIMKRVFREPRKLICRE